LDTIRSLVLMVGVFQQVDPKKLPKRFSLDALWHHSTRVGALAQAICRAEGASKTVRGEALTAGLLHDWGMFLLAVNCPEDYGRVLDYVFDHGFLTSEVESDFLGCNHAELGAYLLGIWGLPDAIVGAVAFHHFPNTSADASFGPLAAVHVADVLERHSGKRDIVSAKPEIDQPYLDRIGLTERIAAWKEACLPDGEEEENQ